MHGQRLICLCTYVQFLHGIVSWELITLLLGVSVSNKLQFTLAVLDLLADVSLEAGMPSSVRASA